MARLVLWSAAALCSGSALQQPVEWPIAGSLVSDAGCSLPLPTSAEVVRLTVQDGWQRTRAVDVQLTPGALQGKRLPLLLVLHAAGGTAQDARRTGFDQAVSAAGDAAVIVMPQGLEQPRAGVGWNQHCSGPDMPLYDAIVRAVSARYCIDASRIMATGFSWGADMAHALACCRGDSLLGIATFSGDETDSNAYCPTQRTPAVRLRFGTAKGAAGDGVYTRAQFEQSVRHFQRELSCARESDAVGSCQVQRGCSAPLVTCEFSDMGHEPPSPPEVHEAWAFLRALR